MYSTLPVQSERETYTYDEDTSDNIRVYDECVVAIALARDDGAVVLLGNTSSQTVHTPVGWNDPKHSSERFQVRMYNSERSDWEQPAFEPSRSYEKRRSRSKPAASVSLKSPSSS